MASLLERWQRHRAAERLGSLRNELLRALLIPLVALVALNAVSVYRNALEVADVAYDRSLLASTRALAERVAIKDGKVVADVPYVALDSFETDTLGRIYYKVSGIHGELVSGFGDLPPVPANVPRSEAYPALVRFYHASYNGEQVRIAALLQPVYDDSMRGIALIQVGETLDARRGLSRKILLDTLWWQALMVLAVAALVWFSVRRVLRPLMRLKTEVQTRDLSDLSDVDPDLVHKEVRPLVDALNGTMGRMQRLIASQRRFIADAAHQLRTPLTVLKTQAGLALRTTETAQQKEIVQSMAVTTDSAVNLANRLLMLARIEHEVDGGSMEKVSLRAIAQQTGLEMAPAAVQKNIDLSLDAQVDGIISGQPLLLHELLANLLDNALRYTPCGGQVALTLSEQADGRALLTVEDSGPGIPEAEREKVFAPFYRVAPTLDANPAGAGLGLAIARDIAQLHGASLALETGAGGSGLRVSVRFAAA